MQARWGLLISLRDRTMATSRRRRMVVCSTRRFRNGIWLAGAVHFKTNRPAQQCPQRIVTVPAIYATGITRPTTATTLIGAVREVAGPGKLGPEGHPPHRLHRGQLFNRLSPSAAGRHYRSNEGRSASIAVASQGGASAREPMRRVSRHTRWYRPTRSARAVHVTSQWR